MILLFCLSALAYYTKLLNEVKSESGTQSQAEDREFGVHDAS